MRARTDHTPAEAPANPRVSPSGPASELRLLQRALGNRNVGRLLRGDGGRLLQRQSAPPLAKGSTMYWPGLEPPKSAPPPLPLFERPSSQKDQAGAKAAMDEYRKLSAADRKAAFDASYPKGSLAKVLKLLGSEEAARNYPAEVRQLTRWAQEYETRQASGMTDAQIADAEAKWVYAKNKKAAEAKAGKPVSDVEVETERKAAESKQSYYHPMAKTRYQALSAAQRSAWTRRPPPRSPRW